MMIARNANQRRCTRPRFMPFHAAHAASVAEFATPQNQDYTWDDAPVTAGELLREFVGGVLLVGGAIIIAWVVLA